MASDIWLRTTLIVRKETSCRHICYSYRLIARVLLYAPTHRQDNTYHGLCYTSHGALAGTRNSSMGRPHEGSIRRPIAPWANARTIGRCENLHTENKTGVDNIPKTKVCHGAEWETIIFYLLTRSILCLFVRCCADSDHCRHTQNHPFTGCVISLHDLFQTRPVKVVGVRLHYEFTRHSQQNHYIQRK